MAAILNLPAFAQAHKAVAGTSLTVTRGTEAWDIAKFHEPVYDFIKRAVITHVKLCGAFFLRFGFIVASDACAGASADL